MQRCVQALLQRSHSTLPWFIDKSPSINHSIQQQKPTCTPTLPQNTPTPLRQLHANLMRSPYLEPSTLVVTESVAPPSGPELPLRMPQGRRKRGGTYAGESDYDVPGAIWNWVVMAQVKEGTENKGAIESVVRVIRKTLLAMEPPLPIPPNSKRRMHNGWALIDAGDFAVHILSREAREKYFTVD